MILILKLILGGVIFPNHISISFFDESEIKDLCQKLVNLMIFDENREMISRCDASREC